MTIGNIDIEFNKITTLGLPWTLIGGPRECCVRSFGALGASWELVGPPKERNAKPNNKQYIKLKMLDDPIMMAKQ